ncbi:MAG: nitrite/sulfite reductase [Planctomycetaceae bacterium]
MKTSNPLWKQRLDSQIPDSLAQEIEAFETEMQLRQQDKVEDKVFAESRLRRGVYGQRYDNGQRHDGIETRKLNFSEDGQTKGPDTAWDAPGMQRIKIPYGGMNPEQLELMADLAEEYSDSIVHITTRQDVQLHFIHIEDTPALMRRLATVDITTREACGNSVRNITGCPYSGVCADEAFDVTPYARALTRFLLGHPDAQNFGRKFKPTFSGCRQHACGLTALHDLGFTAVTREQDGAVQRGFHVTVGGGLGAVPHQAKVYEEFLPVEEMMPLAQAISRVFARHGEKKTRSRARLKFLVSKWGIDQFKQAVQEERAKLEDNPIWTDDLQDAEAECETPLKAPGESTPANGDINYARWLRTNIRDQSQVGYATVTVVLPLGDLTGGSLRVLADFTRVCSNGTIRTTVEQNFVIRWVSKSDLPALYQALEAAGLASSGAGHVQDIVTCPGTDTCKLGISASRGLAGELLERLTRRAAEIDPAIEALHVKISGCFNSCGQHHVADIGFYGVSRNVHGYKVPHFQVVVGGQWEHNAGSYGLPIVAIPSKKIPEVFDRLAAHFLQHREPDERFPQFVQRVGKTALRDLLDDLTQNHPEHDADPDFYRDWGDTREYSTGDIGRGECAGEVVSAFEFEMVTAERLVFDAQVKLDASDVQTAGQDAYHAMIKSAKALVLIQYDDVTNDPEEVIEEFEERYYDTELFFDPYAGAKFAHYLFAAHKHQSADGEFTQESAHHTIEEAQLFIEAVHSCYNRIRTSPVV